MEFNLDEYKEALIESPIEHVRGVLRDLHFKISSQIEGKQEALYKSIDAGFILNQCKSKSTYKKFVLDPIWENAVKRRNDQENAIEFILHLFTDYNFYAEYYNDQESGLMSIKWDNGPSIVLYRPEEGIIYDCFYWRTEQSQIGIATMRISSDWMKAEMVFHYKKKLKTKTYLKGDIRQEGSNLYITLIDDPTKQHPYRPITTLIVLYASPDKEKRRYLLGCFSSVNRDSQVPICGLITLHESKHNSIDESPFIQDTPAENEHRAIVNIPSEIAFTLTQKRLKIPEKVVQISEELPLFEQYDKLKNFAGPYQAYFFTFHSNEHAFKTRRTEIMANGVVRSFLSDDLHDFDEGYIRRFGNVVTIQFKYEQQYDTNKYHYYLQIDDRKYLRGIFAGVSDNGLITSGKIILKRLEDGEVEKNQLIRLSKSRIHPDISTLLENTTLSNFFGTIESDTSYDHFTDVPLVDYISGWNNVKQTQQSSLSLKRSTIHQDLEGTFECFCITKDTENTFRLPDKNIILEQLPIKIEGTKVTMLHGGKELIGNILYDGHTRFRMIFFDNFYTMTFTVPLPKSDRAKNLTHMFGIVSSINLKHPEASAAVLIKTKKPFDDMEYNRYHTIEDLIPLEREYQGLISFLMGDWNRFIRVPSTANRKFRPKYSTYRRSFWAAACYWGGKYQDTKAREDKRECLDNLVRSFRHAFAMSMFGNTQYEVSSDFPNEIQEDREMLLNEMDKSLNFPEARKLIAKLWMLE